MTQTHQFRNFGCGICIIFSGALSLRVAAQVTDPEANPIARIARIFSPQLVDVEYNVSTLESQLSTCAQRYEHALKVGLGYRGCRTAAGAEDPTITLDLGSEVPIGTIFLVPAQREFFEDPGIFPRRFTLELSNRADFGQRTILYTSGVTPYPPPDGIPVAFKAKDTARYVRMTVQEGHNKGTLDLYRSIGICRDLEWRTGLVWRHGEHGGRLRCSGNLVSQGVDGWPDAPGNLASRQQTQARTRRCRRGHPTGGFHHVDHPPGCRRTARPHRVVSLSVKPLVRSVDFPGSAGVCAGTGRR